MTPSTIKIDVKKILKQHMYKGTKGTYLDCAIWPNKNGPDEYGNTHYVTQSVSKEARAAGVKGAIIGNIKWLESESKPKPAPKPAATKAPPASYDSDPDETLPF